MTHVVFVISTLSFSLCLFCSVISVALAARSGGHGICRAVLLFGFVLFLFSQAARLYLGAVGTLSRAWAYEMQEIAIVFFIPALSCLVVATYETKRRTLLSVISGAISAGGVLLYVYGNHVNTSVWFLTFPLTTALLSIVLLYSAFRMVGFKRVDNSGYDLSYRLPGIVTVALVGVLVLGDTLLRRVPTIPWPGAIDMLLVPLLGIMWSGTFIAEEVRAQIKRREPRVMSEESLVESFSLSPREAEVALLLVKGKRYDEIGETLFISKSTVKTHIFRVYAKLNVNSKIELVNRLMTEA
jgi:DNA-binding CsgD family transcriptional regulator